MRATRAAESLSPDAVEVWFLDRTAPVHPAWTDVLDPDERLRAAAFRTAELRDAFVAAHALVRTALSAYAPVAPGAWRFEVGPKGQPRLVDAPVDLRFSLSHSGPSAAVAVGTGAPLGLDLESLDRAQDALALAERFFTPAEAAMLRGCGEAERPARFATLWTVKEAVLKAEGLGLSTRLSSVEVTLNASGQLSSVAAPGGPWSVRAWETAPGLRVALAVGTPGQLTQVRTFAAVPLGDVREAPEMGPPR